LTARATLRLAEPTVAAPGQAAVIYDRDRVRRRLIACSLQQLAFRQRGVRGAPLGIVERGELALHSARPRVMTTFARSPAGRAQHFDAVGVDLFLGAFDVALLIEQRECAMHAPASARRLPAGAYERDRLPREPAARSDERRRVTTAAPRSARPPMCCCARRSRAPRARSARSFEIASADRLRLGGA
jgi:hypothetical protein